MLSANSLIRHDANEDATPEVEIKSTEKANGGENSNIRDEGYSGRNDRLKVKGELEMKAVSLAKGGEKLVGFDLELDDLPKLTDAVVEKENENEKETLETSAKHHIPQATNIPYQPC